MMEPVAWAWRNNADDQFVVTLDEPEICWEKQPLVRLSDAEARIAELEAELAEADALIEAQQHDFAQNNIRNAENAHKVASLEALVEEARTVLEPFAALCSWLGASDWSMKHRMYAYVSPNADGSDAAQVSLAYFRAARAILAKIGGRDAK